LKSVVVCSLNDPAGTNIRERMLETYGFKDNGTTFDSYPVYENEQFYLACSHKEAIFIDDVETYFGKTKYYFASKHWAESGIPALTAHITGNFGANEFGGNPGEISTYSPDMLTCYMQELNLNRDNIPSKYQLTLEATHHGPTSLHSPSIFVELGATMDEWKNVETARQVAEAIVKSEKSSKKYSKRAIAIGGTHYPSKFNELVFGDVVAIGAVMPKHALQYLNKQIFSQLIEKSTDPINLVAVDVKGLGKFKEQVMNVIKDSGIEMLRV
jgi:D-aminoacyl-tRNA deacylase